MVAITIALQGILRRKRQLAAVFVILTFSLALMVVTMSYSRSIVKTNAEYRLDTYGEWYGAILDAQDGDVDFLRDSEWIEAIGTTTTYGEISVSGASRVSYIGTVDDAFVEVGRISLSSGRLPETSGEIAMEANMLNTLGRDYTLGQEITLTILFGDENSVYTTVTKTFILCGIVDMYTGIWTASGSTLNMLNTAIIVEQDAVQLLAEAQSSSGSGFEPEVSLFFSVKEGFEDTASSEVSRYLSQSRASTNVNASNKKLYVNTIAFSDNGEAEYNTLYIVLILIITILAIIVVYIIQMKSDIRRIVRFRSAGATKLQVGIITFTETLATVIPAMLFGIALGALGTWTLLMVAVFAGSASVVVDIPGKLLIISILSWFLCTLAVRFISLQIALSTPLIGRMEVQVKKSKRMKAFQIIFIVIMSIAFCFTFIFTVLSSLSPLRIYTQYSNYPWYQLSPNLISGMSYNISDDILQEIATIAGIKEVRGYSVLSAKLVLYENEYDVTVNVIDDAQWIDVIDFSTVDPEAFRNGDVIILSFPEFDSESVIPAVGDNVSLAVKCVNYEGSAYTDISTTVGGININDISDNTYALSISSPYSVVCSKAFLQKILDSMPDGTYWNDTGSLSRGYRAGSEAVYACALVFTEKGCDYLITDTNVSKIAWDNSLTFANLREFLTANAQIYLQTLILLLISGLSIAFVVLIILSSTLRLETEREKRRYGILQAIGMSKRQRNLELVRTALVRSVVAVVLGWGLFILTVILRNLESLKEEGATVLSVVSGYVSNITNYYMPVWAMVVMTAIMFAVVFIICLASKLGLNKYSLMEMLHDE